jgi:hypothetical protein
MRMLVGEFRPEIPTGRLEGPTGGTSLFPRFQSHERDLGEDGKLYGLNGMKAFHFWELPSRKWLRTVGRVECIIDAAASLATCAEAESD